MIFNWFKRKEESSDCRVQMFLADGTPLDAKKIAWIEGCVTAGKERERQLQVKLEAALVKVDSLELASRLAYDFLYTNCAPQSHGARGAMIVRRVLRGRTQLAGVEHALRSGVEAGHVPADKILHL